MVLKMADLVVVLDPGASLTKIWYSYQGQEPKLLLMEPEVIRMDVNILAEEFENKVGQSDPENSAWVQVGEKAWAVGSFARTNFAAPKTLIQRKYIDSLPKVLAAIGVIFEREKIPAANLSLYLGVLLPKSEWEDRKTFEDKVKAALECFRFRHRSLSLKLEDFNCSPEGAGVIYSLRKELGEEFKSLNVGVLIIGFRNCSYLTMNRGIFGACDSSNFGFVHLVKLVKDSTSGLSIEQLTPTIYKAGSKVDVKALAHLVIADEPEQELEDIQKISAAIKNAQKRYWASFQNWLKNNFPDRELDMIVQSGGSVDYFKPWLKKLYPSVSYLSQLKDVIKTSFPSLHPLRLEDSYGFFQFINESNNKRLKKLLKV